jgi:uncharacterized protein YjdB
VSRLARVFTALLCAAPLLASGCASTGDPVAVDAIAISYSTGRIVVGDSVAYSVRVLDANGRTVPRVRVAWTSSDTSVARVNVTTGVAHAVGPGEAMIGASSRGRSAFVALAVLATPDRR